MRSATLGWLLLVFCVLAVPSVASPCGGTYTVKQGDTLMVIASDLYGDVAKWSVIHDANKRVIGADPNNLRIGMTLTIGCLDGLPRGLQPSGDGTQRPSSVPLAGGGRASHRITLLTASRFPPFTDKSLPGGGMLTELVQAAMEAAAPEGGFAIHWVDDLGAHEDPLLSNALLDLGFPWAKPDCAAEPDTPYCVAFLYSAPMFETLTLLFVHKSRPIAFLSEKDLKGRKLCLPTGAPTFILDQQGRNWLRNGHITLRTGASPRECLDLLMAGDVDGAVLNEFLGHALIREMGLQDRVSRAEGLPLSIDTAHVVAHRSHPAGAAVLAVFDEGLARIRADGTFQRIVDTHLARIWAEF